MNRVKSRKWSSDPCSVVNEPKAFSWTAMPTKQKFKIPTNKFDIKSTNSFDKNATIIVYCTIGARSEEIGEKLIKDGFKNVYNLYGGLIYWKNQGYPIIDSKGITTKDIHVYSKEWRKWLRKGNPVY
jgi:rhodanese-related sulfurtransferase